MQNYQFSFRLKNCRVPLGTGVPLHDLREAHACGMNLIWRMLERVGRPIPGCVLRICDAADQPLLHVIVPAQPADGGAVGERNRGERVREEAWSAAIARLDGLAGDRRAGHGLEQDDLEQDHVGQADGSAPDEFAGANRNG